MDPKKSRSRLHCPVQPALLDFLQNVFSVQNVLRRNQSSSACSRNGDRKGWPHSAHRHMLLVEYWANRVRHRRTRTLFLDRKTPLFLSYLSFLSSGSLLVTWQASFIHVEIPSLGRIYVCKRTHIPTTINNVIISFIGTPLAWSTSRIFLFD